MSQLWFYAWKWSMPIPWLHTLTIGPVNHFAADVSRYLSGEVAEVMPTAQSSICLEPRCPHLAVERGRCKAHQTVKRILERRHYTGIPGVNYGRKWGKARQRYLSQHPFCAECRRENPRSLEFATQLDHVIPHKGNAHLFWDESNWQGLCESHHSQKTAREMHATGGRG